MTSYSRAWFIGERTGTLKSTIDAYKFERVQDAAYSLASLLGEALPNLPPNTILVHIPSINSHIRQRGYDHTLLIAKSLAKNRRLEHKSLLTRFDGTVQLGNSKQTRMKQAADSFRCHTTLDSDMIYLLIDDVVTTNATVRYAARVLKDAGASTVWVAVLARQPLHGE